MGLCVKLIALSSYLHLPYREGRASGTFLSQENPVLCSVGLTNTASESPCWLMIARLVSKLYLGMANLACNLKGTHLILYNTRPSRCCSATAMAMCSLQVTTTETCFQYYRTSLPLLTKQRGIQFHDYKNDGRCKLNFKEMNTYF